jgi:hypothetical protein
VKKAIAKSLAILKNIFVRGLMCTVNIKTHTKLVGAVLWDSTNFRKVI